MRFPAPRRGLGYGNILTPAFIASLQRANFPGSGNLTPAPLAVKPAPVVTPAKPVPVSPVVSTPLQNTLNSGVGPRGSNPGPNIFGRGPASGATARQPPPPPTPATPVVPKVTAPQVLTPVQIPKPVAAPAPAPNVATPAPVVQSVPVITVAPPVLKVAAPPTVAPTQIPAPVSVPAPVTVVNAPTASGGSSATINAPANTPANSPIISPSVPLPLSPYPNEMPLANDGNPITPTAIDPAFFPSLTPQNPSGISPLVPNGASINPWFIVAALAGVYLIVRK